MENQTKNGVYLIVDLEMTGLNPFLHGVVEFWAIAMDAKFNILGEFMMDLCPPAEVIIDPEALKYNGFTLDRIARGKSYEEFSEYFIDFLSGHFGENKPIIVGQYVTADISFMQSVFYHARRNNLLDKFWNDIIDTKSIANQANAIARYHDQPVPFESTSLSKPGGLWEKFMVSAYKAHSARGDIMATREVLMKFLQFG